MEDIEQVSLSQFVLLASDPHPGACRCEACEYHLRKVDSILAAMDRRIAALALHDRLEGKL